YFSPQSSQRAQRKKMQDVERHPVRHAECDRSYARRGGLEVLIYPLPGAYAPRFIISPAAAGSASSHKIRSGALFVTPAATPALLAPQTNGRPVGMLRAKQRRGLFVCATRRVKFQRIS